MASVNADIINVALHSYVSLFHACCQVGQPRWFKQEWFTFVIVARSCWLQLGHCYTRSPSGFHREINLLLQTSLSSIRAKRLQHSQGLFITLLRKHSVSVHPAGLGIGYIRPYYPQHLFQLAIMLVNFVVMTIQQSTPSMLKYQILKCLFQGCSHSFTNITILKCNIYRHHQEGKKPHLLVHLKY